MIRHMLDASRIAAMFLCASLFAACVGANESTESTADALKCHHCASKDAGISAPTVVPTTPTGLVATPGNGQVSLTWSANPLSDQVARYQVYRDDALIADGPTTTSYVDTGLTAGITYTYRVSAWNAVGYGPWTDALVATPTGGAVAVAPTGGTPGIGLVHYGDALSRASNASQYSFVIVSQDDAPAAAKLPGISVAYAEGTGIMEAFSTGVTYDQALANGWLLTDGSGSYLRSSYGEYLADIGDSAYQQAWIASVAAFVRASGITGTFMDNVVRDPRPLFGGYPAKYPTSSAWQQAMVSFVAATGPALRAKGIYVLGNVSGFTEGDVSSNDGTLDVAWFQQVGPYLSGLMDEFYAETAEGSETLRAAGTASWMQNWDGWQRLIGTTQAMGKDFVGLTYGAPGDTRTMVYGKASFLMEWDGGHSAFVFNPNDNSDPWSSAWTTDIGAPAQAKEAVGVGWMRQYTRGMALVNPSPSSSQTFELPRPYVTSSGQSVTTVTLAPTTGMLLTSG